MQKTINRKHCSVIFPAIYPYIRAKLHGKILQRLVSLAISSSLTQQVEDSTLDKGAEAETCASHWCDLRFPLCSDADDTAWAGAALLGTQSTNKHPNNWEEQLFLFRAAKGGTENQHHSQAQLGQLERFLSNNILFPQLFLMLATLRHYTSLAMTCSSGAVLWAFPFFTVILSLHRDISPVTQPLLNQFPTGRCTEKFQIKILVMPFKRHWTKVSSLFIPSSNLHSRQNCQIWKSFRCVHVAFTLPSHPHPAPCQIHPSNCW